ncbi:uncharacterized protein isoform X2 [Rhodnius prolixus]|uniref:uncharacterized protein isoform X2 n=1 Tax=Rhodnius prolixus TaxID=13249 RepID=UPI003D18F4BB
MNNDQEKSKENERGGKSAPGPTKKAEEVETNIMKRFYRPVISEKCEQQRREMSNSLGSIPMDSLNTEFIYYSTVLKDILPAMSKIEDKNALLPWVGRLYAPEYHSTALRSKRNRHLLQLCLSMLNDEVLPCFQKKPADDVPLPKLEEMAKIDTAPARWENEHYWQDLIADLPEKDARMGCSVHEECSQDAVEEGCNPRAGALLDQEFMYFLHMAKPYAALISIPAGKAKVALWLQTLATIRVTSCLAMKGIRNDYMQTLLGYIHDLRVTGPFQDYPSKDSPLPPLAELAELYPNASNIGITNPGCAEADEFIASQPKPENGAFCYVAVTGNLKNVVTTSPFSRL